ncbi:MAG: hemerythrin family protein [Sideroxydans sp.]|nr:hemerythrin family protein [Sideroxydans sp.]
MLNYPQVTLDFMNHDHAEFVALRDQLLSKLSSQTPAQTINDLLTTLLQHTRQHFAEEERLMCETNFPPFPVHKGAHDAVLADMTDRAMRWKRDGDQNALREWLDGDVGDWFVNHVSTMDFVTARFIAAQQTPLGG